MNETKDFSPLHDAHKINFNNAKESMLNGLSPIIIDNTCIKANEAKNYVVEALKNGYDDNNIIIIDIGTNGLDAEELSKRNTHGVPIDKIKSMIDSYKSVGALSVQKIIDSKDFISENYFDIPTNSWDLTNIDQVLYSARQLCIKRSKSSYPPKIV
jgi:hypothetical protein